MGTNKIIFLLTAGLVVISTLIIVVFERKFGTLEKEFSQQVRIMETWELPEELEEISGFVFIGSKRLACIQDEEGIIFIYDLNSRRIVEEIPFKESGDFEGIAVDGNTAYVVESNGTIYEVENFLSQPSVKDYSTRLKATNDVEGLVMDKAHNRLLLAIKGKDPDSKDYKGIYAFNLENRELEPEAVFTLTFEEEIFEKERKTNVQKTFRPSEISIAPDNNILLLEGEIPKLLILSPTGKPKALHYLDDSDFPQPEGLAFDPDGNMYISNEGNPATIHFVQIE